MSHPTPPSQALQSLGGIQAVHAHTTAVADYLALRLKGLRHYNGAPLVKLAGRWDIADWNERWVGESVGCA